jgi:hypothetical protein
MVVNGIALMMARMSLQGVSVDCAEENEAAAHSGRHSRVGVF